MRARTMLLVGCLSGCLGCGGAGVDVEGEVRFEGRPVENGHILFTPLDAGSADPPAAAPVEAGRYRINAKQGLLPDRTYRVEITNSVPTGRKVPNLLVPGSAPVAEVVNTIPVRYRVASALRATTSARPDENKFDYLLTK